MGRFPDKHSEFDGHVLVINNLESLIICDSNISESYHTTKQPVISEIYLWVQTKKDLTSRSGTIRDLFGPFGPSAFWPDTFLCVDLHYHTCDAFCLHLKLVMCLSGRPSVNQNDRCIVRKRSDDNLSMRTATRTTKCLPQNIMNRWVGTKIRPHTILS